MSLLSNPSACYPNCCEIAFDSPAHIIHADYYDLIGETDHKPELDGYHSSIVNQCFLERFGRGICQIDMIPVIGEEAISDDPTMHVSNWFKRPGLQAVITGERPNGEFHANAYRNGSFIDSDGTRLDAPNIAIKYVWVLGVPPFTAIDVEGESA
jgi:hypothetical protein